MKENKYYRLKKVRNSNAINYTRKQHAYQQNDWNALSANLNS